MSKEQPSQAGPWEENLPPEAATLMHDVIDGSLMRYDVLRFFFNNPYAILTISDLTVWLSREERPLAQTLQELAALGYLEQSAASAAFVLSSDPGKRRQMDAFFGYLEQNPEKARLLRAWLRRPAGGE